ncbi:MAG: hypothetical protein WCK39_08335 [Methanomassiliicoccales archaeon]
MFSPQAFLHSSFFRISRRTISRPRATVTIEPSFPKRKELSLLPLMSSVLGGMVLTAAETVSG